jgi:hypothetical protein
MSKHMLAVLGLLACASVAACAKEPPAEDTAAARAALEKGVRASLEDPGSPLRTVPSTLPGVATWTLHVGAGVAVVGKTADDVPRVVIAWRQNAAKNLTVAGCAIAKGGDCNEAARALGRDLPGHAPAAVTTQSLHPAANGNGSQECAQLIFEQTQLLQFGAGGGVECLANSDGIIPDGACTVIDFVDGSRNLVPNLAGTCCKELNDITFIDDPNRLLDSDPVQLVCGYEGDDVD